MEARGKEILEGLTSAGSHLCLLEIHVLPLVACWRKVVTCLISTGGLYYFARAAVTNYHKLYGLKQPMYSLTELGEV